MVDHETAFRSLDGTRLIGTVSPSAGPVLGLAVLVHGAGVTRDEGGFFTRLATGLAASRVECLRFDLRAHGASGGRGQDLTIAGVVNDIRAAVDHLRAKTGRPEQPAHVIAASFSGGAASMFAAHRLGDVGKLVLLNPRLDYRERYVTSRPYFTDDYISDEMAGVLDEQGFTEVSGFALGRALLNEVQYLDASMFLAAVRAPVLMVHGTKDTFVPVESSRRHVPMFGGPVELLELDGAQHGFAVHDDPQYADPQTKVWQAQVIEKVTGFLTEG